jgi:cell wall-associated NlpC family hydrolase
MLKTLCIIIFIGSKIVAAECEVHIEKVENNTTHFMLILNHDENCEVMMNEQVSKIVLISQAIDKKVSKVLPIHTNTSVVHKLITLAKSKLGDSYVYAAAGPDHFDCSGFVYYIFKENGITIPRTSLLQSKSSKKLNRQELKKGDILSFDTAGRKHINHSGIYLGNGKFIHSSSGKAHGVTISELDKGFYKDKFRWGVRKLP